MPAQATKLTPQQVLAVAKTPLQAYNDKNWPALKAALTPDFAYHEVATGRKTQGVDELITLLQEWATAIPDSKASIESAVVSGDVVVLELTWRGTHQAPLNTSSGAIPATGKPIQVNAVLMSQVSGEKLKAQRHYFDMLTLMKQVGAIA